MGLEIINEIKKQRGMTTDELSEKSGVPLGTLNKILAGQTKDPKLQTVSALARVLGCTLDDFDDDSVHVFYSHEERGIISKYRTLDPHGKRIVDYVLTEEYDRCQKARPVTRVYTYYRHIACAGDGFVFDDIPAETIEANECPGADFIIGVNGDSMEPTFFDGDLVYVRRADDVRIGAIGIFTVNNECFIKERGEECLISHNPNYPNIPGTKDIRCIGEVLEKVTT